MKTTILILFFCLPLITKGQIYEIDASERILNLSSFAKLGEISVFIISTHSCSPCLSLKKDLINILPKYPNLNVYTVFLTKNSNDIKKFKKRRSTQAWGYLQGVTSFPTTFILNQAGNIVSVTEGKNSTEILEIIDDLQQYENIIDTDLVMFGDKEQSTSIANKKPTEIKLETDSETIDGKDRDQPKDTLVSLEPIAPKTVKLTKQERRLSFPFFNRKIK